MRRFPSRRAAAIGLTGAALMLVAACGGGDEDGGSTAASGDAAAESANLVWWHNATNEPLKSVWTEVARDFEAQNPNIKIKVQPIQNEQFTTKVPLALQGDDPPDVYQQWGGGQQADQVRSGKVADLTEASADWIGDLTSITEGWKTDGKQYGIPYSQHVVGFWYRKNLFEKAGITEPPATIAELNEAVDKLKAAGIAPIAIGAKDRWPAAFYWDYFVLRRCAAETVQEAMATQVMDDPCFIEAGEDLKAFLDTEPFQDGFQGTTAQQGAGSSAGMVANGKAAMELQGTWNPYVMSDLTDDKNLDDKLGWFPFPAVEGGAGDPKAALGGGDGFSCTTKQADACAKFLEYIVSPEVQEKLVTSGSTTLPVNPAAAGAIEKPTVKEIQAYVDQVPYTQTYFDVALPTAVGQALNEAIADFVVGQGSPEDIVAAVR